MDTPPTKTRWELWQDEGAMKSGEAPISPSTSSLSGLRDVAFSDGGSISEATPEHDEIPLRIAPHFKGSAISPRRAYILVSPQRIQRKSGAS
jgi:hypothetical protein